MAIRQLGYSQPARYYAFVSPARTLLNKFQNLNGLPVSDIVDQNVIMALDNQLVASEQVDAARGPSFPLYARLADPPINEPSRLHATRLRDIVFAALPPAISPISMLNQEEYIALQQNFMMSSPVNPDASQVCDGFYYSELGDHCGFLGNQIRVINDDFIASDTALHEYAHFLDANIYATMSGTAMGSINTTGFYSISYDTS